jgi:mono/diheme cytochrome c family protein
VRTVAPALLLTSGLGLAGCGGASPHKAPVTLPATGSVSGAVVFAHDCQSCHSLIGNESEHKQGGDLLGYDLTRQEWVSFTRVMPTRPLSAAQLNAVVSYILRVQARH